MSINMMADPKTVMLRLYYCNISTISGIDSITYKKAAKSAVQNVYIFQRYITQCITVKLR